MILGGGFAGLRAARVLSNRDRVHVTLIDKKNHHLFQPLLYQVATAGLSPADIAVPIRSILAEARNIDVVLDEAIALNLEEQAVTTTQSRYLYDELILACGARHSYFGHNEWASAAPGLKTIEEATLIRKRILLAFEHAEIEKDPDRRRALLTFILVGGGPTGVELAGSLAELSQQTLSPDFKHIDPRQTRVLLIEAGPRLLGGMDPRLSEIAQRNLQEMGVEVWTGTRVTDITSEGVAVKERWIPSFTVIWSAGVQASMLKIQPPFKTDPQGRLPVNPDLSLPRYSNVFVCGDQACFSIGGDHSLPGLAAVAMQEGEHAGLCILADLQNKPRSDFHYRDKGLMATIGRSRAVLQMGERLRLSGFIAWLAWLLVHVYYLIGFKNRLLVLFQWAWAYFTFKRGARLIVEADETKHEIPWPGRILRTEGRPPRKNGFPAHQSHRKDRPPVHTVPHSNHRSDDKRGIRAVRIEP